MRATVTAAVVLMLLAIGCAGAQEPVGGPPVVATASAEDQTCSRDSECVLVQDCCGCDRQGRQLAVHRDRVTSLAEASRAECGAISCTVARSEHVSCSTTRAACRGGRCIPAID